MRYARCGNARREREAVPRGLLQDRRQRSPRAHHDGQPSHRLLLDAKGITYIEQTANTNDEVVAAASALIAASVDAVFTPTDNVIMAAEMAIAEDLAANGIPHYTGADSFVRNGAYATCGVNYTDLGAKTADLAYKAITEGMDGMEDYYLMDGGIITVNTETAAALDLDYSAFNDLAGTVVEVETTAE